MSEFIKCECGTHAIEVNYVEEEKRFEISFWELGHIKIGIRERLRWCWHIIKTGNPWADETILNHEKAKDLVKILQQNLNQG